MFTFRVKRGSYAARVGHINMIWVSDATTTKATSASSFSYPEGGVTYVPPMREIRAPYQFDTGFKST